MEKKTAVALTLSGLIFLAIVQACFVKYTNADPFGTYEDEYFEISPLAYPSISILYPAENNTLQNQSNLIITFKATLNSGSANTPSGTVDFIAHIDGLYHKPSWESNNTKV